MRVNSFQACWRAVLIQQARYVLTVKAAIMDIRIGTVLVLIGLGQSSKTQYFRSKKQVNKMPLPERFWPDDY
ncbi:hypothetical protein [Pseudomonas grandcourensis]|uniref:hypothetical protein n=1 Tax=Pseudomonas grandcourensis TaxID=3136736 RepID=UPI003264707A